MYQQLARLVISALERKVPEEAKKAKVSFFFFQKNELQNSNSKSNTLFKKTNLSTIH
jgi:hypothetical protein